MAVRRRLIAAAIVLATLALFSGVRHNDFINYDDPYYVLENRHVNGGLSIEGVRWAFTTFEDANWFPLTWLSHMADVSLWGLNPAAHHLTNAVFHALASGILFLLLSEMGLSLTASLIAVGLFAVHPLRVESVAWASERKDVLSAVLALGTLITYVWFTRKPSVARTAAVALAFAVALMAKAMPVTLPFVMLLLDYWPLRRWPHRSWLRLVREKAPLFLLSAAAAALAVVTQSSGGATASLAAVPLPVRASNAVVSYLAYLKDFIWPVGLAVFYRKQPVSILVLGAALAMLVAISWGAWTQRSRRPYLLVGWLWYLGMLVPVIGLLQIGSQARADRYTYLPMIGISLAVARFVDAFAGLSTRRQLIVRVGSASVTAALAFATVQQVRVWRDSVTLFEHARRVTPPGYPTLSNLGEALAARKDYERAAPIFAEAITLSPADPAAHVNLATALNHLGLIERALIEFEAAVRLDPASAPAWAGLGATLSRTGHQEDAITALQHALKVDWDNYDAHYNLAHIFLKQDQMPDAIVHMTEVVRLKPSDGSLQSDLGAALATVGRYDEAIRQFEEALRLDPTLTETRANLNAAIKLKAGGKG